MKELKTKKKTAPGIFRMFNRKDLLKGVILFFVSRASLLGGYPMTLPFFAAMCDISVSYIYLPIILIGSFSVEANIIKYFLASLIYWLISEFKLHDTHRLTNSIYCGGLIILSGLTDLFYSGHSYYTLFLLITEGILSGIMYYAFSNTAQFFHHHKIQRHITKDEIISFVLLICSVIAGICNITLPLNINVAQLAGIYLMLCVIMYTDITVAIAFSMAVGFASIPMSADSILLMGIMASGAACASLLKIYGKYGTISGFLAGVAIAMFYISHDYTIPISITSLFLSSGIFILTPGFTHKKINSFFLNTFYPCTNENDARIKDHISSELKNISSAFKKLSNRLLSTSEYRPYNSRAAASSIFDMVTSRVCIDCPNSELCWRENLNDTCKQLFLIIDIMEEKGVCDMTNIPIVFSQKCRTPEKFITEFNHVYEMYKQDSLWRTEADRGRDLIAQQYSEISSIIKDISLNVQYGFYFLDEKEDSIYRRFLDEKIPVSDVTVMENSDHIPEVYVTPIQYAGNERLRKIISSAMNMPMKLYEDNKETLKFSADNLFYTEISVKQRPREGQEVSGDSVIYFETCNNKFYVILCDGMGSGNEALYESRTTAELLKEFIIANIQIETAIKMINSSLALKTRHEVFSTVDLLEINLLTGETHIYKVGSAQSYMRISGKSETVFSKTLPIGIIENINITHEKKKLSGDDIVVMVSDGISEADYGALRGEWIKKIMAYENEGVCELSTFILNDALKKIFPNVADDMTVIVIKLKSY